MVGKQGRRKKILSRLIEQQPYCILCGGTTLGTSADHIPSKSLFDQRPAGLEFLACADCNNGFRQIDAAMGALARNYPKPDTQAEIDDHTRRIADLKRYTPNWMAQVKELLVRAAKIRLPDAEENGLLHGMDPGASFRTATFLYGLKLGLALHFLMTSEIVPAEAGVFVSIGNALNVADLKSQAMLNAVFPAKAGLKQGKKNVDRQFQYTSQLGQHPMATSHSVRLYGSFTYLIAIYPHFEDAEALLKSIKKADVLTERVYRTTDIRRVEELCGAWI